MTTDFKYEIPKLEKEDINMTIQNINEKILNIIEKENFQKENSLLEVQGKIPKLNNKILSFISENNPFLKVSVIVDFELNKDIGFCFQDLSNGDFTQTKEIEFQNFKIFIRWFIFTEFF